MSDIRSHDAVIHIQWQGYDTARYVRVSSDTLLRVSISSSGFSALRHQSVLSSRAYPIVATTDTSIFVADYLQSMVSELGLQGVRGIESRQETLALVLQSREGRAYVPRIRNVRLSFVEQYGLYGSPRLTPDTVWLYGSRESLDKIATLETEPVEIEDISQTATYTIPLKPVWSQYPDLRASVSEVSLEIPTALYVERTFQLPIQMLGNERGDNLRIYPEQAKATFWIAEPAKHKVASDMFHLAVDFSLRDTASDRMPIRVVGFPDYVRVKQLEPSEVRYVVIK